MRCPTTEFTSIEDLTKASAKSLITLGMFALSAPMITGLFLRNDSECASLRNSCKPTIQSDRTGNRRHAAILPYLRGSATR